MAESAPAAGEPLADAAARARARQRRPASAGASRPSAARAPPAAPRPCVGGIRGAPLVPRGPPPVPRERGGASRAAADGRGAPGGEGAAAGGREERRKLSQVRHGAPGEAPRQLSGAEVVREIEAQWAAVVTEGRSGLTRYGYVRREKVSELSIYGRGLDALDRPEYQSAVTSISFHCILVEHVVREVAKLARFQGLSSLTFSANQIFSMNQLEPLKQLASLTDLSVVDNPACGGGLALPLHAARLLPGLKRFNGGEASEAQRRAAAGIFQPLEQEAAAGRGGPPPADAGGRHGPESQLMPCGWWRTSCRTRAPWTRRSGWCTPTSRARCSTPYGRRGTTPSRQRTSTRDERQVHGAIGAAPAGGRGGEDRGGAAALGAGARRERALPRGGARLETC
ncbi:unnamed protein product, partial [Prorocentrum cordatum]